MFALSMAQMKIDQSPSNSIWDYYHQAASSHAFELQLLHQNSGRLHPLTMSHKVELIALQHWHKKQILYETKDKPVIVSGGTFTIRKTM